MLYHLRVSALFDDRLVCLYNNFDNMIENSEYPACGVGRGGGGGGLNFDEGNPIGYVCTRVQD